MALVNGLKQAALSVLADKLSQAVPFCSCGGSGDEQPYNPSQLTEHFLTRALRQSGAIDDETSVQEMDVKPMGAVGLLSEMCRVLPVYSPEGAIGPDTIIVKFGAPFFFQRFISAFIGYYRTEAFFYNQLCRNYAAQQLRMPRCYFAAANDESTRCAVLLEDISQIDGFGKSCDQMAGCSLEQAMLAIRYVARFHATHYNHPEVVSAGVAASEANAANKFSSIPHYASPVMSGTGALKSAMPTWEKRFKPPPEAVAVAWKIMNQGEAFVEAFADMCSNLTVAHGDYRLDNIFFNADNSDMVLIDFQCVRRQFGEFDLAHLLTAGGANKIRATHEAELVELYAKSLGQELQAQGSSEQVDLSAVWTNYKAGIVFFLPTLVGAANMIKPEDARGNELLQAMNDGLCDAIVAHGLGNFIDQILAER